MGRPDREQAVVPNCTCSGTGERQEKNRSQVADVAPPRIMP